jgi:iron(II)-dependent oxidoreductase
VSPTELAAALEHARRRTDALLKPLSDEQLTRQVSPLQSPLVWDLAHIGHFEELWLLRQAGGRDAISIENDELYDSFAHARSERGGLPILSPGAARAYVDGVREAVLALLPELPFNSDDPLLEHGFVVGMVVQHELQHGETMAQTLALAGLNGHAAQRRRRSRRAVRFSFRAVRSRWAPRIRGHTTTNGRCTTSSCRPSGSTALW